VQRTESYTGIDGINQQDRALQESMGPIVDRSKEHLGPGDKAIGQARRMLRQAVMAVKDGGDPAGTGTSYYHIRAGEEVLPNDADWHEIMAPDITKEKILQTV
jgi:phthalate 4,5-dioxygenase